MRRRLTIALAVLALACDVEASLGSHDAGIDSPLHTTSDAASDAASLDASTDAHPLACHAPADAGMCLECQAAMCCAAFDACSRAATCPCIVGCVLSSMPVADCMTHCGADHGEHAPLIACAQASCDTLCN